MPVIINFGFFGREISVYFLSNKIARIYFQILLKMVGYQIR